ncbi:hypothetical protein ACVWZK_008223 [Bradyrhizobium sp. GM0.4]
MAAQEHWLARWAMDLMLINVLTRRFARAVRLPEGDVQASAGSGGVKVGCLAEVRSAADGAPGRLHGGRSLSALDLLVVQIDGLHLGDDLVLATAIGVDGEVKKHPWRWWKGRPDCRNVSGPTGRSGFARARPGGAKTVERCRRRSAAPSVRSPRPSAARSTRCANIMERLPKEHHAATRRVLRQPGSSMTPKWLKN